MSKHLVLPLIACLLPAGTGEAEPLSAGPLREFAEADPKQAPFAKRPTTNVNCF